MPELRTVHPKTFTSVFFLVLIYGHKHVLSSSAGNGLGDCVSGLHVYASHGCSPRHNATRGPRASNRSDGPLCEATDLDLFFIVYQPPRQTHWLESLRKSRSTALFPFCIVIQWALDPLRFHFSYFCILLSFPPSNTKRDLRSMGVTDATN